MESSPAEVVVDRNSGENEKSPEDFKDKIYAVLHKVTYLAVGEFAVSAVLIEAPQIVISLKTNSNSRRLHFPIYEDEADRIMQSFEQSPYGKGSQTIVDTSVRNSWELEPQQFEILNPKWDLYIKEVLLPLIGKEMKIDTPFTSSLYKLLLYKTGSFFKPHRDSEKEDGMFATLVIQLPSKYKGGQLRVSHDGKAKTFDLSSDEFSTYCSAFYCDCEHEVLPVTEGFRICLIYNLISQGTNDFLPVAPERSPIEKELKAVLNNWDSPGKIVFALKHKYTQKSLSFANLKTTDRAIAAILKYLSKKCALEVHLAILEKESRGDGTDYGANMYYGFSDSDDIDFDSDEEYYSNSKRYELNTLISLSGHKMLSNTRLDVDFKNEVIPEYCFSHIEPYHKTQEPMGNGGVHCSKFYRNAAIVFWPKKYFPTVLKNSRASYAQSVDSFIKEVALHKGKEIDEGRKRFLIEFAELVVKKPENKYYYINYNFSEDEDEGEINYNNDEDEGEKSYNQLPLLAALGHLKDVPSIQKFFESTLILNSKILPLVVDLCLHFGMETFSEQLIPMILRASSRRDATEFLELVLSEEDKICFVNEEKRNVIFKVMNAILDNYKDIGPYLSSWPYLSDTVKLGFEERRKILNTQEEDAQSIVRVGEIIMFNKIELLKKLFQKFIIMSKTILPWVVTECNKHGWEFFVEQIPFTFERVSLSNIFDAAELVDSFIGKDVIWKNGEENWKREICCQVLDTICKSIKRLNLFSVSSKVPIQEADQDRLVSICFSAHKINFRITDFLKTVPLNIVVPVLIKLEKSAKEGNVLEGQQWLSVSKYFVTEMESLIAEEVVFNWSLNITNFCPCRDCDALNAFLKWNYQSRQFKMRGKRSMHLHNQIIGMADAGVVDEIYDDVGVVVVTKTVKGGGQEEFNKRNSAIDLLPKLLAVMPR